ncbi:YidH family protein [Desulfothermobacter acidiphilus]|uniref:YidH family protein n=1 Tax=Desulfothermobacter acidiphilus TaxID=1938353 RepID=UPI003F8A1B19
MRPEKPLKEESKPEEELVVKAHVRAHLANERTFLAWVRTCLALIAFGFVLVRWTSLVEIAAPGGAARVGGLHLKLMGEILLGGAALLLLLATGRFLAVRRQLIQGIYRPTVTLDLVVVGFLLLITVLLALVSHHAASPC